MKMRVLLAIIAAAIMIPAGVFLVPAYWARSQAHEEARTGLELFYVCEKSFYAEWGTYTTDLVAVNCAPDGAPRYTYGFCNEYPPNPQPSIGLYRGGKRVYAYDARRNTTVHPELTARFDTSRLTVLSPCKAMSEQGIAAPEKCAHGTVAPSGTFHASHIGFCLFAVANIDDDPELDVWSIDPLKTIQHIARD